MQKIEKDKILKVLNKLDVAIVNAEKDCDDASNQLVDSNYDADICIKYKQKYGYLQGLYMAHTIINNSIKEMLK